LDYLALSEYYCGGYFGSPRFPRVSPFPFSFFVAAGVTAGFFTNFLHLFRHTNPGLIAPPFYSSPVHLSTGFFYFVPAHSPLNLCGFLTVPIF